MVLNSLGQVLVVSQHGKSWSLPKGHIDPGEDALAAAKREIWEETGVKDLQFIRGLGEYSRFRIGKNGGEEQGELKIIEMFLYHTNDMTLAPQDPENPEARWVDPFDVADRLTHPKDKEFFQSVLTQLELFTQISTTFEKKEAAQALARHLLENQLAACIQILPIESHYQWKGKIENASEWLCLIKTKTALYSQVEKAIKTKHTYDVPEIIATPIIDGSPDYLKWMANGS